MRLSILLHNVGILCDVSLFTLLIQGGAFSYGRIALFLKLEKENDNR